MEFLEKKKQIKLVYRGLIKGHEKRLSIHQQIADFEPILRLPNYFPNPKPPNHPIPPKSTYSAPKCAQFIATSDNKQRVIPLVHTPGQIPVCGN